MDWGECGSWCDNYLMSNVNFEIFRFKWKVTRETEIKALFNLLLIHWKWVLKSTKEPTPAFKPRNFSTCNSPRVPHRKKGEFFAKIQVSQRRNLTRSEKNFGGHYLLQQKHFRCITSTQETNTMLGLRSPNLKGTLGTRLAYSFVGRQLNLVTLFVISQTFVASCFC